jgi:hypothetical protein
VGAHARQVAALGQRFPLRKRSNTVSGTRLSGNPIDPARDFGHGDYWGELRMVCIFLATGIAMAMLTGAAQAGQVVATDPATIVKALQGAGYKADLTKDGSEDPLIKSSSSDLAFELYFYGCTDNTDCKTVQFSATYDDGKPTLSRVNEWNANKRWGQGFQTDDGSARVQMDLDLEKGGMTTALFVDNLEYWVATMASFEKFMADKDK